MACYKIKIQISTGQVFMNIHTWPALHADGYYTPTSYEWAINKEWLIDARLSAWGGMQHTYTISTIKINVGKNTNDPNKINRLFMCTERALRNDRQLLCVGG